MAQQAPNAHTAGHALGAVIVAVVDVERSGLPYRPCRGRCAATSCSEPGGEPRPRARRPRPALAILLTPAQGRSRLALACPPARPGGSAAPDTPAPSPGGTHSAAGPVEHRPDPG